MGPHKLMGWVAAASKKVAEAASIMLRILRALGRVSLPEPQMMTQAVATHSQVGV
jgi:hypothetical protein